MRCSLLLLLLVPQDAEIASKLKRDGWTAVDELASKSGAKAALAELAAGKDAELAWWADAAMAGIEGRELAGGAYAPPQRVTFEARDRSAGEVLRELLSSAKGRPIDVPEGDRPVTVSFRGAPFLEALDEVCRQAGLVIARGPGGRLQAVPGDPPRGPRFHHGGFAASVLTLVRRTDVTFREDPVSQLQLTLLLRSEPRLRIVDAEVTCVIVRAEDDTGRSLLRDGPKPTVRVRPPAEGGAVAQLSLAVPADAARKISLLRGTAALTLARKVEEIVFENVGKAGAQAREAGGIKASLAKVEREKEEIRLELELSAKEKVHWPDIDSLALEDAEGRPYQRWGSSMNSSGMSATYRLTFRDRDGLGVPEKFRLSVVTETYPRRVPFELKDVVLK